jgi:hypothetical protein
MSIPSETVAIPVVKGLDVTTDLRLLQAPSLLEATNARFSGGGSKKRRGHVRMVLRNEGSLTATPGMALGEEDDLYWTDDTDNVSTLLGVATRDNETVLWDGVQMYSYLPSQTSAQAPFVAEVSAAAVLPSLRAVPMAKTAEAQNLPQMADNGTTRIVVWKNASNKAKYAIYDSTSDALIASGQFAAATVDYFRVFTLGGWMHVAIRDNDDDLVKLYSISSDEPNSITYRSYGDASAFDLWKMSESVAALAKITIDGVEVRYIGTTGVGAAAYTPFLHVPTVGLTPTRVAVATCVDNTDTCVIWWGSNTIGLALYTMAGVLTYEDSIAGVTGLQRLTIATKEYDTALANHRWDIYWDDGTNTYVKRAWGTLVSLFDFGDTITRYRQILASRAWNVGDRTFVWTGHSSTLQSTWFLLDEGLLPVGKMDFGIANVSGIGATGNLAGVNWYGDRGDEQYHLALSYKMRVVPDDTDKATAGVYAEPTIKGVYLDFLPSLNSTQAGRTLYIAGAQLWAYDGRELVEAGFHTGPEPTFQQVAGGTLTAAGEYSYRIDLCHRNAQNEEVRSLSILSDTIELTPGNQRVDITIPTVLTRRTDSYFLIYRNAMSSGTPLVNWWLLNSRDPSDASYLANTLTSSTVSFSDTGAVGDEAIQTRELHPATDTYLQPISAPACEIIASGRDRLWVAGGELSPGELAPSRLFAPGETPSFNAYLNIQVDRSNEPVTALGFAGEVAIIFRSGSTYLLDSDGPDNIASGSWSPVRLAHADVGAVSQASVARIPQGLIFQSPAGFRIVGPGGGFSLNEAGASVGAIGYPVDSVARDFTVTGSLVVEKESEVRFYGETETYVFNYMFNTWSKWTCGGVGVAKNTNGYALLAREDGELWIEDTSTFTDAGNTYTHRIRTAWLHAGMLGDFQRVRAVGGIGRFADLSTPNHTVRVEFYYDTRDFWEDRIEWTLPDSTTNTDTWGAGTWGAGVWGDTSATVSNLEDLTWDWIRGPAVQKCNAISISVEDVNTDGPGFELSAITLELARKSGLNRGPHRTGTGSYR